MKATRICSFPGCERPLNATGLCSGHRAQRSRGQELRPLHPRRTSCAIEGCARKHSAHGYCALHYRRLKNNGDPEALLRIPDGRERFDTFYEKADGCWLWTGSLTWDGYGVFREDNRRTGAHRFAYEYFVGPIPKGHQIDHLCRVRNCVNPDHLEPVTPGENTRRGWQARGQRGKVEGSHEDYVRWVEERLGA